MPPRENPDPLRKILGEAIRQENGCLYYKLSADKGGYGRVRVGGRRKQASRIVLESKLGRPIRVGYCALHTCDHPPCVEQEHLYEGTHKENSKDTLKRIYNPGWKNTTHKKPSK